MRINRVLHRGRAVLLCPHASGLTKTRKSGRPARHSTLALATVSEVESPRGAAVPRGKPRARSSMMSGAQICGTSKKRKTIGEAPLVVERSMCGEGGASRALHGVRANNIHPRRNVRRTYSDTGRTLCPTQPCHRSRARPPARPSTRHGWRMGRRAAAALSSRATPASDDSVLRRLPRDSGYAGSRFSARVLHRSRSACAIRADGWMRGGSIVHAHRTGFLVS
jgi:hypothetical protein